MQPPSATNSTLRSTPLTYDAELEFAYDVVICAARACSAVQSALAGNDVAEKADRSPVTVADLVAQAIVTDALRRVFPGDQLVAEEDVSSLEDAAIRGRALSVLRAVVRGATESSLKDLLSGGRAVGGERFWTLDPVDGTKGFLRKEQYAVALALLVDGEPVLGVMGCPNLPSSGEAGCLFAAVKRECAFETALSGGPRRPVRVSQVSRAEDAVVCESVESGHSSHSEAEQISSRLGIRQPPMRMDSQCKYGLIARGEASIYLRLPTRADYEERIWDHAAGWLLVREAGGEVTDVEGKPLDFSRGRTLSANRGIVATNGQLHGEVISAVRAVLSGN